MRDGVRKGGRAWLRGIGVTALLAAAAACADPEALTGILLTPGDRIAVQVVGPGSVPRSAPAVVRAGRVTGHELTLDVAHAGGCRTHRYAVLYDGMEGLSLPPVVRLHLVHDDARDTCEALVTRQLVVDLRPLRAAVSPGGTVLVQVVEPDGSAANLGELRYDL